MDLPGSPVSTFIVVGHVEVRLPRPIEHLIRNDIARVVVMNIGVVYYIVRGKEGEMSDTDIIALRTESP
jgi:hypothetical protein